MQMNLAVNRFIYLKISYNKKEMKLWATTEISFLHSKEKIYKYKPLTFSTTRLKTEEVHKIVEVQLKYIVSDIVQEVSKAPSHSTW